MMDTVLDTGELNEHSPDWRNVFTGLLGGYQVYEHVACSHGLRLEAGPNHAVTCLHLNSQGAQLRWMEHDLRRAAPLGL